MRNDELELASRMVEASAGSLGEAVETVRSVLLEKYRDVAKTILAAREEHASGVITREQLDVIVGASRSSAALELLAHSALSATHANVAVSAAFDVAHGLFDADACQANPGGGGGPGGPPLPGGGPVFRNPGGGR